VFTIKMVVIILVGRETTIRTARRDEDEIQQSRRPAQGVERQQPDEADSGTIAHARATNQFAAAIVTRDGAEWPAADPLKGQ
jgi:hypothetical protein